MLSNCGHDEKGGYSYGKAGDQTGTEWQLIPYYVYGDGGWNCILRHPDRSIADLIGDLAIEAAENDNIGYDQMDRYTFWQQLTKCGYHPKAIQTPCETDCSAGVLAIVKAVGFLLNNGALMNVSQYGYTGNEASILMAAGFERLTDSKYRTSDKYLLKGDILLNTVNHTCIQVTGIPEDDSCFYFHTNEIGPGATGVDVYRLQMILKARGYYAMKIDKLYGEGTKAAVMNFQRKAGLPATGKCDRATWHTLLGLEWTSDGKYKVVPCCEGYVGDKSTLLCQELLKASGYYTGKLNWNFDKDLRKSLMKFQKAAKKLVVNGVFDKATARWMIGE